MIPIGSRFRIKQGVTWTDGRIFTCISHPVEGWTKPGQLVEFEAPDYLGKIGSYVIPVEWAEYIAPAEVVKIKSTKGE